MKKLLKNKKVIIFIIAIIIIVITIVNITKSKNNEMSKDEMLIIATELDGKQFYSDVKENIIRTRETYINKVYTYTYSIGKIESNYITMGNFNVYLSQEEIKKLDKGQQVTVVGIINNIEQKENITAEMKQAFLIQDVFEITGNIEIPEKEYYTTDYKKHTRDTNDWYCYIKTTDNTEYHLEDYIEVKNRNFADKGKTTIVGTEIVQGNNVTITGKIINNSISGTSKSIYSKDKLSIKDITSIVINK